MDRYGINVRDVKTAKLKMYPERFRSTSILEISLNSCQASNHVKFDCILFQTVASIDREKAERLDKEWRENLGQCPLRSQDMEDIRRHQETTQMTSV